MTNKTHSAKLRQKERLKEAKARRKIASDWKKKGKGHSYQKASAREFCSHVTSQLQDELFDGILINLREKNSKKSYSRQKRILRRIIEKRQAQLVHHVVGRTQNAFASYVFRCCLSKSTKHIFKIPSCTEKTNALLPHKISKKSLLT